MSITWPAKPAAATHRYEWTPGAGLSTLSATASGATVTSELDGDTAVILVSGGANGQTAAITLTATNDAGETFSDIAYVAIRDAAAVLGTTARDICTFALRPVVGVAETADADLFAIALEALNDMLHEWRIDGLDVGVAAPLVASDIVSIRDEFLSALRWNLRVRVAMEVFVDLPAMTYANAERAKMLVATKLLSFAPLSFEGPCIASHPMTGIND